jgi:hypothetical protein
MARAVQPGSAATVRLIGIALAIALAAAACGGGALDALQGLASRSPAATPTGLRASGPIASRADAAAWEAAIAAFVDRVTGGDLSYRMALSGRAALSVSAAKVKGRMDVEGDDYLTDFTYTVTSEPNAGDKFRVQIRQVKGKAYANVGDGWHTLSGWRAEEDSNSPFQAVTSVRDVTYLGTEERKGATVYRIAIPDAHLIDPATIPGLLTNERIRTVKLELLIDANGKPITGTWKLDGQGRVGVSGQLQQILYELNLTFSKIGTDFKITKP